MSTHEIPVTVPVSHIHPFTLFDDLVHFSLALCHRSEASFMAGLPGRVEGEGSRSISKYC
ncbi:hypothetical protein FOFC_08094 [Fusarium oxysporum]|nr:hypothetical protein FOFC_18271 [Fusarium oxysporum]KAI8411500.1 hypothetical protein FOFC_08094 [Fusarium oxysporum]